MIVGDVFPDSAAEKAGLMRGDVITAIDGEKVKDVQWFVNRIRSLAPGSALPIEVVRDGKTMSFKAQLNERPNTQNGEEERSDDLSESTSDVLAKVGLGVAPLTKNLSRKYNLEVQNGLVVVGVKDGSSAQISGIREGDRLLQVNGRKVETLEDLDGAMKRQSKAVVLLIDRGGKTFFVSLQADEEK